MGKRAYMPALLWKRILAFLIDLIAVNAIILSPFQNVLRTRFPDMSFHMLFSGEIASMNIPKDTETLLGVMSIFTLLYFAIMEYKLGQTIGKILTNLSVVSTENNNSLRFWQCVLRSIFLIPMFPFMVLWIVDPLYMFFDQHNQRLLERWSKTMTIQIVPPAWYKVKSDEIPAE